MVHVYLHHSCPEILQMDGFSLHASCAYPLLPVLTCTLSKYGHAACPSVSMQCVDSHLLIVCNAIKCLREDSVNLLITPVPCNHMPLEAGPHRFHCQSWLFN